MRCDVLPSCVRAIDGRHDAPQTLRPPRERAHLRSDWTVMSSSGLVAPTTRHAMPELVAAAHEPVAGVLAALGTSERGLDEGTAAQRLREVGPNVLASHRTTALGVLLRQLRNPLLILLLAAAGVSALTGDPSDASIIAVDHRPERRPRVRQRVPLGAGRSRRCTRTSATRRSSGATGGSSAWTFEDSFRAMWWTCGSETSSRPTSA